MPAPRSIGNHPVAIVAVTRKLIVLVSRQRHIARRLFLGRDPIVGPRMTPISPSITFKRYVQNIRPDAARTSGGKTDRLYRTPAKFTALALDGYELLAALSHASFRPLLAMAALYFANPSLLSTWIEDFHLQTVGHARHTKRSGDPKAAAKCLDETPPEDDTPGLGQKPRVTPDIRSVSSSDTPSCVRSRPRYSANTLSPPPTA